jgi:hypothetical protein
MDAHDTPRESRDRQLEAFRRMTPEQRSAEAAAMSDEIRAVAEAGLRHRHPDFSDDEIRAALVAILLR